MSAEELSAEHGAWGEHPEISVLEWQHEVSEGNTRLGYWPWVESEIQARADFPA